MSYAKHALLILTIFIGFSATGQVRIQGNYYRSIPRPSMGYFDFEYTPLNETIGMGTGFALGPYRLKSKPLHWFTLGGYFGIPTGGNADGISSSVVLSTIQSEMNGNILDDYDYFGNDGGLQFGARVHLNLITSLTIDQSGSTHGIDAASWLSIGGRMVYHMPMVATYSVNSSDASYYYYQFIDVPYREARISFAPEIIFNLASPYVSFYGVHPGIGYCYQPQPIGDPLHTFILRLGMFD